MAESKTASRPPSEAGISQLLRNPALLRLLGYWRSKRSGRAMPSRRDVDPTELPWALSRIFLVDYSAQAGFRHRPDRSSVVQGKRVSVRVDFGGRRVVHIYKITYRIATKPNYTTPSSK